MLKFVLLLAALAAAAAAAGGPATCNEWFDNLPETAQAKLCEIQPRGMQNCLGAVCLPVATATSGTSLNTLSASTGVLAHGARANGGDGRVPIRN